MAAVKTTWNGKQAQVMVEDDIKRKLEKSTLLLEREIKLSFKPGTGRQYKRTKSGKFHIASVAGKAPAVDTGRLRAGIARIFSWSPRRRALIDDRVKESKAKDGVSRPKASKGNWIGRVGTNVDYASFLEFGTSKMRMRPFMRRSIKRMESKIKNIFKKKNPRA